MRYTTVGAYEAKTHLSGLLEKVAQGERVTITKHGVPVALLIPVAESSRPDPREAIARLKAFRHGRLLGDGGLRDLVEEGRRF